MHFNVKARFGPGRFTRPCGLGQFGEALLYLAGYKMHTR